MPTLEVCCQASLSQPADDGFLFEIVEERITLRELIARTVREQIRLVEARERQAHAQKLTAARRQLDALRRQYLTEADVAALARDGRVSVPSAKKLAKSLEVQAYDPEAEIRRAWTAFDKLRYLVLVNGRQAETLDEEFDFHEQNRVTFVRLMPLVGG